MDIELTPLTEEDIELVRTWRNMPEVSQYMYTSEMITYEQQASWFARIKNDSTCRYWVITYNNQKVGLASITGISHTLSSCYWAFYLGDVTIRKGGLGAKVEFNVLDYVFSELKLNKLRCEVMTFNEKVISMHEKFGFRREAYYRQHVKKDGIWQDVVSLAILKSEWESYRTVMQNKIYRI
ncbi:UDP-4-amino-4,6-dideoxy-N-acetyl-beta-L-altrosamine N-acetyltransferase [Spirosoma sp. RP8]|uniref:UDP-4-amino-4, 6-dideoxy-N-acetyl-beta-L-altrosamine N-acetyltransferase n=1 Tax=Spirosoma liriopis TaxID=2937440 RepID=A0ABT0HLN0_9BACT|nr:UDP-4-amino-4,6-dideoxy-N-acetyl-beta-L-altrosamine N-acetyltransferase [Spirosoma liriopis]MCK8493081.1 UDP-4-amino-4,6-dideoxy-N-acetyl-beta-L-altrosamine N-acetyltransferase [Spirosoma liriopis]